MGHKETNEAIYGIGLLKETEFMPKEQFESINSDASELVKIITSIIKTATSTVGP